MLFVEVMALAGDDGAPRGKAHPEPGMRERPGPHGVGHHGGGGRHELATQIHPPAHKHREDARASPITGHTTSTRGPPASWRVPCTAAYPTTRRRRDHKPTLDGTTTLGYSSVLAMKTVVATALGVLVVVQLVTALQLYGKLGIRAPSWLGPVHRTAGAIAVVLTLFLAYHCLWALGLEVGTLPDGAKASTRTFVHGLLGCSVVGAVVVKLVAVRSRRAPGWFLPLAGGLLSSLLVLAILTSAAWYMGEKGWASQAG